MIFNKIINGDYNLREFYLKDDPHRYVPLGGVDSEYLVFNNKKDYDDSDFIVKCILKYNKKMDTKSCIKEITDYFKKNSLHILINSIDNVNKKLVDKKDKIDPNYILKLGLDIIHKTKNIEVFKLGIYLLSVVIIDEPTKRDILKIALCDEFSFYCLFFHVSRWEYNNEIILNIARALNGWGKLYFIQELKVTNDDIRKYLINSGFKNSINSSILADVILDKIDIVDYLNRRINKKEFDNISLFLISLFNNGYGGITRVKNHLLLFERYFELFKKYNYIDSYYTISFIYSYLSDDIAEEKILKNEIRKYIRGKKMKSIICENISKSNEYNLRCIIFLLISFDIDLFKEVYNIFIKDPNKYFYSIEYLLINNKYRDKAIKVLEDNYKFDYEDISSTIRLNYDYDIRLIQILRYIRSYPYVGVKFIEAGLRSSDIYVRKETISTIYEWYREGDRNLEEFDFYKYLVDNLENENVKELRADLNNLFDREENLDYLDKVKVDIVNSDEWIRLDDDINKIFRKSIVNNSKELKIKKKKCIDNIYEFDIDGEKVIINMSIDNRIKWYSCTCNKKKCIHICRCIMELMSKEV